MPETEEHGIVPVYKPHEYIWLKRRLALDLPNIDDDIMEIPSLIQQAGELTSTAIEIRETAKEDYERAKAHAAEILRNTSDPKGKQRSETAIQSQVVLSPEVEQRGKELSTCRLDAALWQSLTEALRSKNSAIRVVADLLNSGFLTSSSIMEKRRREIRNVKVEVK